MSAGRAVSLWTTLTWNGRASVVYYWLRGLVITPPPADVRCCMGGVVDPAVWCPKYAGDDLWCKAHKP